MEQFDQLDSEILKPYEVAATRIDQLKLAKAYSRVTIHDINNSLAKINNALWLMAREPNCNTPLFRTCRQIVESEISEANQLLKEAEPA